MYHTWQAFASVHAAINAAATAAAIAVAVAATATVLLECAVLSVATAGIERHSQWQKGAHTHCSVACHCLLL
jgi:hypothetical protein